jgi:hypothetical protein
LNQIQFQKGLLPTGIKRISGLMLAALSAFFSSLGIAFGVSLGSGAASGAGVAAGATTVAEPQSWQGATTGAQSTQGSDFLENKDRRRGNQTFFSVPQSVQGVGAGAQSVHGATTGAGAQFVQGAGAGAGAQFVHGAGAGAQSVHGAGVAQTSQTSLLTQSRPKIRLINPGPLGASQAGAATQGVEVPQVAQSEPANIAEVNKITAAFTDITSKGSRGAGPWLSV